MGQSQAASNNDPKYKLEVDEKLNNILKEEVKPTVEEKTVAKKGTKYFKFSSKSKQRKQTYVKGSEIINNDNSDDEETEEEESEIYTNYITDLVDIIYSKNINMQMKNTNSRSAYNTIFDIRNIVDSKEDLNNDDFNKKSCKIMQEITEPDVPDKIIQKKEESKIKDNDEEEKENLITQNEEGENSDEDEGNYIENDFFKTWDYHIDIFRNYKEDKDDYDLNLDFSYDEKDKEKIKKDKSKGLNISKNNKSVIIPSKRTLNKTLKRNNTDEKKLTVINTNKLPLLEDIIKFNKENDMNQINKIINNNIIKSNIFSKDVNNIIDINNNNNNINNKNEIFNKSINKNDISAHQSKNNIDENEIFEIINNDDINKSSHFNNNEINSGILFNNKQNSDIYNRDDENHFNMNISNTKKEIINTTKSFNSNDDSINFNINEKNSFINEENKKINNTEINNKKSLYTDKNNLNNNQIYKKKKIISNNSKNSNNNSIFSSNKNNYLYKTDNYQYNDIHNISAIKKTENNNILNDPQINLREIYNPKKIRAKTPLITKAKKRKRKNISKPKLIINDKINNNNDIKIKQPEFNKSELFITKTENFDFVKNNKIYISKTPVKKIRIKKDINPQSQTKIDFLSDEYNYNSKVNIDINNINKTIKLVEQQIKSIEKKDKKYRNKYNYDNKNANNTVNIKNINNIQNYLVQNNRNLTPLKNYKKTKKKKKIHTQKTFNDNDMKGYAEIMTQRFKERNKKNSKDYNPYGINRNKSTDIQLRRKKIKKLEKAKNDENNNNFIFGKQKYKNNINDDNNININWQRRGMKKNKEE